MASFSIDYSRVKGQTAAMEAVAKKLQSLQGDIRRVQRTLALRGQAGESVRRAVDSQAAEVSEQGGKASALAGGLTDIVAVYTGTETKVKETEIKKIVDLLVSLLTSKIPGSDLILPDFSSLFGKGEKEGLSADEIKRALLSGSLGLAGTFFGKEASVDLYGELLGMSTKLEQGAKVTFKEKDGKMVFDEVKISAEGSVEGHLAKGKLSGSYGATSVSAEGTIGKVGATGGIGICLFKDGKFAPHAFAKAEAKATAAEGSISSQVGSDDMNIHSKASGELLTAKAKAEGAIGQFTYEDEATGQTKTAVGVKGTVGAEAYVATGKVSKGFTFLGIKVDATLSGHVGGAGGKVGGYIGTGGVKGTIGAGLGLGATLDLSVDWSDFKLPEFK